MSTLLKPELSAIKIRNKLLPGDLGYIAHVHGDLYAKECGYGLEFEAYVLQGLRDFAHEYDEAKDRVWICEHENKIIGFLVAQHRGDAVQLRYFIFLPEYRGIGLGKQLMNEFLDFVKSGSYRKAYLWTTEEQHSAIELYTRYGFKLSDEKPSNSFGKALIEQRYDLLLDL